MKSFYLFSILFSVLFIAGCSSLKDTANLTSDEKFAYAMSLFNEEDYDEAVNEFQAIILQYPGSSIVDDAQFYLAETRFRREEFILAAYEYSKLISNMPASEFVTNAQFQLAECYYQLSPNYTLDQRYTSKAIEEYQAFIDFFPLDERVNSADQKIKELNEKLALKEFSTAEIYSKMDYSNAAIFYYTNVLENYHDTKLAPQASYKKILILIDRERNNEALTEINRFLQKYPEDENYAEIERLKTSIEISLSASR